MLATRRLGKAAQHAPRTPSIKFIGKRTIPSSVDHTPQPHPASPSQTLPVGFDSASDSSSHASFSSYRDHAQQFGPLRKSIRPAGIDPGVGWRSAAELGPLTPKKGEALDVNELPQRFHRQTLTLAEIEAIETGGATSFA